MVSNLAIGDSTTFSIGLGDIDEVEGGVAESGAATNAVHTQDNSSCPQAFNYLANPIDVSPSTAGSWQDVDVSLYVPPGATGVIIQWVGDPSNDYNYGIRMNGSSDTFGLQTADGGAQGFLMAGVDANRIFEVFTGSTTVTTYLVGYTMGGVTFFLNAPQKTLSLSGAWEDVDISADTAADTAIGALFTAVNTNSVARGYGVRKKGSTDSRTNDALDADTFLSLIGVDANEVAQFFREDTTVELYLTGYVTQGAVFFTDAVDKSTAITASYQPVDITGDIGADNANGAIVEIANLNSLSTALRRNGAFYDYYQEMDHSWALTAIDGGNLFEQKIAAVDADIFLTGYTLACVTPSTNYRSIGTALDYGTAETDGSLSTVTATNGSPVVIGDTTAWRAFNRGRGDRIHIDGTDYTIFRVDSETQLTLTVPFVGTTGSGKSYTISRQFTTLQAWENCISAGVGCIYFPVAGGDLVADDRSEVGIAFDDGAAFARVSIDGSITDANHTITLTVDAPNRHNGIAGQGVVLVDTGNAVTIADDFVTVEWLEIQGGAVAHGIRVENQDVPNKIIVRNNLIHNLADDGISTSEADLVMDAYNNIIYATGDDGIQINLTLGPGARIRLLNNTVYNCTDAGIIAGSGDHSGVTLQNNIAHSNIGGDFSVAMPVNPASSNNLSGDGTATAHSPSGGDRPNVAIGDVQFVNTAGPIDLHIVPGSLLGAEDGGADLSSIFTQDIDSGLRSTLWEIGADDIAATTAVELLSFEAHVGDAAVELRWETGSEVDNVGFYLYRATSEEGPFEPVNANVIPGLGSSPIGASYRYVDSGLLNGVTYFYELEDLESTGVRERHGPVSATPTAGASFDSGDSGEESDDDSDFYEHGITYGNPEQTSLRILKHTRRKAVLELVTGGFYRRAPRRRLRTTLRTRFPRRLETRLSSHSR